MLPRRRLAGPPGHSETAPAAGDEASLSPHHGYVFADIGVGYPMGSAPPTGRLQSSGLQRGQLGFNREGTVAPRAERSVWLGAPNTQTWSLLHAWN